MFDNENNNEQNVNNQTQGSQTGSYGTGSYNSGYTGSQGAYSGSTGSYSANNQTSYGSYSTGSGTYQNNTTGNYQSYSAGGSTYGQGNYNAGQNTYGSYQYGNYQMPGGGGNGPKKKVTFKKVMAGIAVVLVLALGLGAGYYSMTKITKSGAFIGGSDQAKIEDKTQSAGDSTANNAENKASEQTENPAAQSDSGETATTGSGNSGIAKAETTEASRTVVTDVTEVVAKAMPAMVSINNNYTQSASFFGETYSQELTASGSGIIVGTNDTELLIATNYHVIEGADSLEVQFVDDKTAKAEVKGTDSNMDLAVIAVQLSDLESDTKNAIAIAALGDSDSLTLGEPAIAIGNALGYGQSVTTGVVSAVNRVIDLSDATKDGSKKEGTFIQTSAAINPGNSGGALLNISGEVIGINSNKIGGSVVEGMGYAIPISTAKPIIEQLMTEKTRAKVDEDKRGYLGISGVSVKSDVSQTYGLPTGVYVAGVSADGGAKAAGIQERDIITKFDGKEISSMDELQSRLAYYEAGETVTITVMRQSAGGYQEQEFTVTLGSKATIQSDTEQTESQGFDGEKQPDAKTEDGQNGQDGQSGESGNFINPFENPFGFGFDFGN